MFRILIISLITFILVIILFLIFISFTNNNIKTTVENFDITPVINGGNLVSNANISYIEFKQSGTFVINDDLICDMLIVGGGGSGGTRHAGGGGAGAVIYLTNQKLNAGKYTINIGDGGAYVDGIAKTGNNGGDTYISSNSTKIYLAKGGGAGNAGGGLGIAGGSSGGTVGGNQNMSESVLTNNIPSGAYGNRGGAGSQQGDQIYWGGGGGGGAGKVGGNASNNYYGAAISGNGGNGIQINITGTNKYYGGGGGGGCFTNSISAGLGGLGGGGDGAKGLNTAISGAPNTGGGGGGAGFDGGNNGRSGAGGSGIVIIRYYNNRSSLSGFIRKYPPNKLTSTPSETNATFNGKSCSMNVLEMNGNDYGNGTYNIYYTKGGDNYFPAYMLFDYIEDVDNAGVHLDPSFNGTTGEYTGGSYLVESDFKGAWFAIKMPTPVGLTNYYIVYRNAFLARAPKSIKLYASIDSINWVVLDYVPFVNYTNFRFDKKIYNNTLYNYYGVVVNYIYGGLDGYLNFIEFGIYGTDNTGISDQMIDNNPILTNNQKFLLNNNRYEYKYIYNTDIPNNSEDGILKNTNNFKEFLNNKYFSNLFKIFSQEHINNINKGNFIVIRTDNDINFILKKYTFETNNKDKAPASWTIYGFTFDNVKLIITDIVQITTNTAKKEDYNEFLNKSDNTYIDFIPENNYSTNRYMIVFTKTIDNSNSNVNISRIAFHEGYEPVILASSESRFNQNSGSSQFI